MTLTLPDNLIFELLQVADAENRDPESLLREMLHERRTSIPRTAGEPIPDADQFA